MKFNKNSIKLFKSKYFLFLLIFTLGVGVLLYQIYFNTLQTSLIEGLSFEDTDKNSKLLSMFSGFFQDKCLSGCVRMDNVNKSKCEEKRDETNTVIYDCPWECDNEKFDKNLNNPGFVKDLSDAPRCSEETEKRDCGKCTPNRVFSV